METTRFAAEEDMGGQLLFDGLARLLIYEVIVWLPLALVVWMHWWIHANPDSGILLLIPFFLGVPSLLGALFVLAPVEALLAELGLGHVGNVAVPTAALVTGAVVALHRGPARTRRYELKIGLWFGGWCGGSWLLSGWVMRWLAWPS